MTPLLQEKIANHGPVSFVDFMEAALYHPQLGYYARQTGQTGKRGDFFTSVSVGPVFGTILAQRFLRWWRETGCPEKWRIIEVGAHDGTLAADILNALSAADDAAFSRVEYAICEPLPNLRNAQQEALAAFGNRVKIFCTPGELAHAPLPGILFANEVLDALPFHLVEWQTGGWRECRVALDDAKNYQWNTDKPVEANTPLARSLEKICGNFPNGYRTEVRTSFAEFLAPHLTGLTSGLAIFIDYGFAAPEYYDAHRTSGTLRTFSSHAAGENPLENPGSQDITAHMDFTAFARAATGLGAVPTAFSNQGTWLTHEARDWLISLESQPAADTQKQLQLLRQFQTLTHPTQLGSRFHTIELAWKNPTAKPTPQTNHRLALENHDF